MKRGKHKEERLGWTFAPDPSLENLGSYTGQITLGFLSPASVEERPIRKKSKARGREHSHKVLMLLPLNRKRYREEAGEDTWPNVVTSSLAKWNTQRFTTGQLHKATLDAILLIVFAMTPSTA